MLCQNDGGTQFPVDFSQKRKKICCCNGIQLGCGFIQNQHTRLHSHNGSKAQQLLLTAGKLCHIFIKPVLDAKEGCDFCNPAANGRSIITQALQTKSQFMPHLVSDYLVFRRLQHIADLLRLLPLTHFRQQLALITNLSGEQAVWCKAGFQVPQKCGFTTAGWAA